MAFRIAYLHQIMAYSKELWPYFLILFIRTASQTFALVYTILIFQNVTNTPKAVTYTLNYRHSSSMQIVDILMLQICQKQ